jgi:endonuclease/exonuclease/phosphatase (EEP) superfamily protein YafD
VRYHDGHDRLMEFYDFLDLEKPEVLCFQEFYSNRRDDRWNVIKSLGELGYAPVTFHKPGNKYYLESMAIFTTLPQIDTGAIRAHAAGKPLLGVFAQLQHGKDTLTVLNTHIKSFDVKGNNPLAQRSIRGFLHSVKEVLYSLSTTTHTQVYQVEQLTERTAQFDNLVFCGDFNTMPSSYLYSRLKRNFHNAYEENGRYFMFTYLGRTLFFLRIDQQFYRGESFENVSFETLNFHLSDHKALLGRYAFD